jgi:hypothetical protein
MSQARVGWRTLTASTSGQIVTNGLLLHLDAGNYASYSGNGTTWTNLVSGNNGTLINGVGYTPSDGGALTFDGVNDYVNCSTVNTGNIFTVQAWAKISRYGGNAGNYAWNRGTLVANSYNWGGNTGFFFFVSAQDPNSGAAPVAGKEHFSISIGQDYYGASSTLGSLANYVNRWVNLSVVVNGTTPIKLFINGIEISDYIWRTNGSPSINYNAPLIIGSRLQENGDYAQGAIGSVNIYNRALSSSELIQNFNATKTRFGYSSIAPLLNNISGATLAYSLRRLRSTYTGSAIRVRRSSDNTEQNIGFDSSGNLDIVTLLQFVGTSNGFVTTWYDQSGNENNAVQSTAGNQPQIISSGILITNGNQPAIQLDGTDDTLILTSPVVSNTSTYHTFVGKRTNSLERLYGLAGEGTNNYIFGLWSDNKYYLQDKVGSYQASNSSDSTTSQLILTTKTVNGISSMFKNGTLIPSSQVSAGIVPTINTIGKYLNTFAPAKCKLQEIVFFNSDQSNNQSSIESNINSHYSIF